jgi:23S rRNA (adenine2503-C2)-methyltransferase
LYKKYVFDFNLMSNISIENKNILKQNFKIQLPKIKQILTSKDNQTQKYVFELKDNLLIESVLLREKNYYTLCISCQVGCAVNCKFCYTGLMGFKRNLNASEIIGQILQIFALKKHISNIVFMGMGEPFLNYNPVMQTLEFITSEQTLNISKRKITISTCGIIQGIKQLIKEKKTLNLAWSIGSTDPLKRIQLMPAENKNPIINLAKLFYEYQKMHNRKLTLEYTLIKNKNDSEEEIKELGNLALYLNAKINLINFNSFPESKFQSLNYDELLTIKKNLQQQNVNVTIRSSKGQDILSACGQLGK